MANTKSYKKKMLLAASVAGLLTLTGVAVSGTVYAADVACQGVNACKGMGDCGGTGHSCAGKNACKGQGVVNVSDAACAKLGGTLAAPAA